MLQPPPRGADPGDKEALRAAPEGAVMRRPAIAILVAMALAAPGCATRRPNIRPVEDNALFRSGQLSRSQLEQAIDSHKVRTVVNLRGFQPQARWYAEEVEVCKAKNVKHVDIALDAERPDREELIRLIETFRTAPQPVLVHSRSPNGRVGFASGLYRLVVMGQSKEDARRELAFWQSQQAPWLPLSELDRFLYEWRGEEEFRATYQIPPDQRKRRPRDLPAERFGETEEALAARGREERERSGGAGVALGQPVGLSGASKNSIPEIALPDH